MTDLARLADIHAAGFVTPRPWSAEELGNIAASPGAFLIEEPHGFLLGRAIAGEAELLTIAVAPDARRQGTGLRLVRAFLAEAVLREATQAFLEVAADNTAARALYTAAGFAEAGKRRGYYATPDGRRIDAVVMARALPTP